MNKKRMLIGVPVVVGLVLLLLFVVGVKASSNAARSAQYVNTATAITSHTAASSSFWTSGWTSISQDEVLTFTHNLGLPPEQLAVELWFKDIGIGSIGIHRANYGGLESSNFWYGAYWSHLTSNTVQVHRLANDTRINQVRIQVWAISPPDYDTGWQDVTPGTSTMFIHGLPISPTDLSISVWFSGTTYGINHFSYGGLTDGALELGAYMYVTNSAVRVYVRPDDNNIEQMRVTVSQAATPDYDSLLALGGWQTITAGVPYTFTHNLNWDPEMLVVRADCKYDSVGETIYHQHFAGGDEYFGGLYRGAHLQNLTENTVQLLRRANDQDCDFARVVIYRRSAKIYLPVLLLTP